MTVAVMSSCTPVEVRHHRHRVGFAQRDGGVVALVPVVVLKELQDNKKAHVLVHVAMESFKAFEARGTGEHLHAALQQREAIEVMAVKEKGGGCGGPSDVGAGHGLKE